MRIKGSLFCTFLLLCSLTLSFVSCNKEEEEYEDFLDGTIWVLDFGERRYFNDVEVYGRVLYFEKGKGGLYYYDKNEKSVLLIEHIESYKIVSDIEAVIKAYDCYNDFNVKKLVYKGNNLTYGNTNYRCAVKSKAHYFD